ncbi:MAG: TRAP transporter large permease subunit [Burkholderiales bacterium]|nr:TRAP transporter large permease subunit [Burkholderiales bacterium]MCA3161326.1 TRAP transporter large permease subunit [Burkholderiales bacterium]MCA3163398.1 TRAP transporter large permease subunit [Burkholderiales bacterium]MCA3165138.1 TRAP transporter large permease subunit [Burkholderiales bacterium]MCA3170288.1 TRAP transporter large permease subunit [Burkholderiales bacterium]
MDFIITLTLLIAIFAILGAGVWIGLAIMGVAYIAMELFTAKNAGDALTVTVWGYLSSWSLTALPLFIWMGEILLKTKLSEGLFRGLAPWVNRLPGRLLHTNVIGCTIFAAVSGSSAATCATIGKISLPQLLQRGYPEKIAYGSLAGAGTLGLLIPPSIIMIVYGVSADVSIGKLFIGGIIPGLVLAGLFMLYVAGWSLLNKEKIPQSDASLTFKQKLSEGKHLIPVVLLIAFVLGSIYNGVATATEAASLGVVGAIALGLVQRTLTWKTFWESLMSATRLYCMIALILAGSAFLTLSMGFIGLPRELAAWIGSLGLSKGELIIMLTLFYILLGCFLDGISMVVLTIGFLLPTLQAAGIDLLWFGIFVVLVVELAQITPPVGFNLFVLQALTKKDIGYIAMCALPFFFVMLVMVALVYFFPQIVTYLPAHM